jgi:hypothetical protein
MTEEEFVDILTHGCEHKLPPGLSLEYIEYYKNNPWQIPNEFVRNYLKQYERSQA